MQRNNFGWNEPRVATTKCYDEVYRPENYRHKTTLDLIGWMKNLRKCVSDLLAEDPFNAELFDKLQARHDAIKEDVEERRRKEGKPDLSHAKRRAQEWLEKEVEDQDSISPLSSGATSTSTIRTLTPIAVQEVASAHAQHKRLKTDLVPSFTINEAN